MRPFFLSLHFRPKYQIHNFFGKSQGSADPRSNKIRKSQISITLVSIMVAASWVVILKMWWGAEEKAKIKMDLRQKDGDRYKRVGVSDHVLPEEFRPEYVYCTELFLFSYLFKK